MLIPRPTQNEPEEDEPDGTIKPYCSEKFNKWWNCPNWICPKCEAVMFGRVLECVYCKIRLSTRTPRPIDYTDY